MEICRIELGNEYLELLLATAVRALMALVMGGFIGLERGRQGRAAGMRTHILVCLGAALASLGGIYVSVYLGYGNDPLRVAAQVISGIGFLGVGTILIKGRFQITGLTTSAGLWTVAVIGLALGMGFYEGAIAFFLCAVCATTLLHRLEYKIRRNHTIIGVYLELSSVDHVRKIINILETEYNGKDIQVTKSRSGTKDSVGVEFLLIPKDMNGKQVSEIYDELERHEEVLYAIESI